MKQLSAIRHTKYLTSSQGFVALISVMIVGAIGISVGVSLLLLGLASSRNSLTLEQSAISKALADACMEEALQKIRESTPYTGTGSLTLNGADCNYTVTSGTGQNRSIVSTGTMSSVVRKVSISIDRINPAINITSWQEIP